MVGLNYGNENKQFLYYGFQHFQKEVSDVLEKPGFLLHQDILNNAVIFAGLLKIYDVLDLWAKPSWWDQTRQKFRYKMH